jgi:hypothetical protein
VVKVSNSEYDLFLRIDSNTRGHTLWFYFSIENGPITGSAIFNICNFGRPKALYDQGLKPYIYSRTTYLREGRGWEQGGEYLGLGEHRLRYDIVY